MKPALENIVYKLKLRKVQFKKVIVMRKEGWAHVPQKTRKQLNPSGTLSV